MQSVSARKGYTTADYRALAERGLTMSEAARELGVTRGSVYQVARTHGLTFRKGKRGRPRKDGTVTPIRRADPAPLMSCDSIHAAARRALDHWREREAEARAERLRLEAIISALDAGNA